MREIADVHPQTTSLVIIGRSAERQDIFVLTTSAGNHEEIGEVYGERKKKKRKRLRGQSEKLGFVIQGVQHAREWTATATSLYIPMR